MQSHIPNVEGIMNEIRDGLEDATISEATATAAAASRSLQAELRKVAETTSLLGRCGGSLRGHLCRLLAKPAKPVVEQIDLFHAAVCAALGKLAEYRGAQQETQHKVVELEKRIQALEAQNQTSHHGDNR